MNSIVVAIITFACCFAGAALGMILRAVLPEQHLRRDTKEVVQLGMGLVATMAALVLGLLVAAAMASFDAHRTSLSDLATDIVQLDQSLAHYGPSAHDARGVLRHTVAEAIERIWPTGGIPHPELTAHRTQVEADALYATIRNLAPSNDVERGLQSEALATINELAKTRWILSQPGETTIPPLFLGLLIAWLFVLFVSFGMFSPANATVVTTLLVCALSVAGAMLMIIDLDQPSNGLVQLSDAPLRCALEQIDN